MLGRREGAAVPSAADDGSREGRMRKRSDKQEVMRMKERGSKNGEDEEGLNGRTKSEHLYRRCEGESTRQFRVTFWWTNMDLKVCILYSVDLGVVVV